MAPGGPGGAGPARRWLAEGAARTTVAGGGRRLASGLRPRGGGAGGEGGGEGWLPFAAETWGPAVRRKRALQEGQVTGAVGTRTVFAELPGHAVAQREALEAVVGELEMSAGAQGFGSRQGRAGARSLEVSLPDGTSVSWEGDAPEDRSGNAIGLGPLSVAALCVEEDLALMAQLESAGPYCLVAAHVCTSFGGLSDRMGRGLTALHDPVPGYRVDMGAPMQALFERMRPDGPAFWRTNWGIQYDSDPDPAEGDRRPSQEELLERFTRDGLGDSAWLRVEFQNLRKLPQSGAVLFTIRTYIEPLGSCQLEDGAAAINLAKNIRDLPPGMMAYKGLQEEGVREAILRYLDGGSREA